MNKCQILLFSMKWIVKNVRVNEELNFVGDMIMIVDSESLEPRKVFTTYIHLGHKTEYYTDTTKEYFDRYGDVRL